MKFWCCEELKQDLEEGDGVSTFTVEESMDLLKIKFCPYCGYKLSRL